MPFDDFDTIPQDIERVSRIMVLHSFYVNAVKLTYRLAGGREVDGALHGSNSGTIAETILEEDEFIARVRGKHTRCRVWCK